MKTVSYELAMKLKLVDGDDVLKIKFKSRNYLLIRDPFSGGLCGAIATKDQYENFDDSFAHLFGDGTVMRNGTVIGTIKDIKFISGGDK